jgi:hypothetical protein
LNGTVTSNDLAQLRAYAETIPGYPVFTTATLSIQAVPEPGSLGVLGVGIGVLVSRRKKRQG